MMRPTTAMASLLALAALACGGEDVDPGTEAAEPAPGAETAPVEEDPGLPTDATEFRPTAGRGEASDAGEAIGGRLWISTASTVEEDGFSLVAQLRNLPGSRAYSWAVHRGPCSAPDDRLFGLGWGTVADVEGRGSEVANGGGPLGEMRLTFTPYADGSAEETVFIPLDETLTRAELDANRHSLRIHPNVEGDDPGASVACAPLPPLPRPGEYDPENPARSPGQGSGTDAGG